MKFLVFAVLVCISWRRAQSDLTPDDDNDQQPRFKVNWSSEFSQLDPVDDGSLGPARACCFPPRFQGTIGVNGFKYGTPFKFFVDSLNQRMATVIRLNGTTIRSVMQCNQNNTCTVYVIWEASQNCTRVVINGTMETYWPRCIPRNATSLGVARLGPTSFRRSLLVRSWLADRGPIKMERVVAIRGCLPVMDVFPPQGPQVASVFFVYYNLRKIKDPSVFEVPSFCSSSSRTMSEAQSSRVKPDAAMPFFFGLQ